MTHETPRVFGGCRPRVYGAGARCDVASRWGGARRCRVAAPPARWQTALCTEGEIGDLGVPLGRCQPPRKLRPEADAEQVRGEVVFRYAARRPAEVAAVREALARCRRGNATVPEDFPDAGRLQEAWKPRHGGRRLVAAPRFDLRRHGIRPFDVHHGQRPQCRISDAHGAALARRTATGYRFVGELRPRYAQRKPAAIRLPRESARPAREEELRAGLSRAALRWRRTVARPEGPVAIRRTGSRRFAARATESV